MSLTFMQPARASNASKPGTLNRKRMDFTLQRPVSENRQSHRQCSIHARSASRWCWYQRVCRSKPALPLLAQRRSTGIVDRLAQLAHQARLVGSQRAFEHQIVGGVVAAEHRVTQLEIAQQPFQLNKQVGKR